MHAVREKWYDKYPNSMKRWEENWDVISPMFKFSSHRFIPPVKRGKGGCGHILGLFCFLRFCHFYINFHCSVYIFYIVIVEFSVYAKSLYYAAVSFYINIQSCISYFYISHDKGIHAIWHIRRNLNSALVKIYSHSTYGKLIKVFFLDLS